MSSTDLGACEWFVWDLRRSNLIDRGQLDQVIGEFLKSQPRAEPPALAEYLVKQGILSDFQAERLLQGKTQGLVLGPYTLMDALGSGSMGTVYKAQNKNDNNWYAVKVLPRRSMWNVRIARRQVRAFEQCRHPAVVPFVDVGTSGGTHYLAWPLVEGVTLEALIQQHGPLDPGTAATYAFQTAEGLEACHAAGLIHGLLKPSNLMIGPDNQVRILDFGIGTLLAESEGESLVDTMSTANSLTSGLDCGSPESILEPTNRTPAGDQYSLGCTLYYCLTGKVPFPEGTAVEKMMAHQTKQPAPITDVNPDVPPEMLAVIDRLMQKSADNRFANATEVIDALRPLQSLSGRAAPRPVASQASVTNDHAREDEGHVLMTPARRPATPAPAEEPEPVVDEDEAPVVAPPPRPAAPRAAPPPARPPAAPPAARPAPAPRPAAAPPPTRQPGGRQALPSRDNLFIRPPGPKQPPPRPAKLAPVVEEAPEEEAAAESANKPSMFASLEERLGTGGVILLAVVAAAVTWFLMTNFLMPK